MSDAVLRAPIFLGDEVSAAGYRLAGLRVRVPAPGEALAALEQARGEADLVLITAACAASIPEKTLGRVLAAPQPLVLIVPEARAQARAPDLAARVRRQLGMQG